MSPVVAALIRSSNKILLVQRGEGQLKGLWEFPGGKVNHGEDPFAAVVREIKEELGLAVIPLRIVDTFYHDYPFGRIKLILIECSTKGGTQNINLQSSHLDCQWITIQDAGKVPLVPLDKKIVDYLRQYYDQKDR